MRRLMSFVFLGAMVLSGYRLAAGQDKSDSPKDEAKSGPHDSTDQLQVKVTYTEYDGEKKVKSFPFVLLVSLRNGPPSEIRVGTRTPIATSAEASASQYQYIDVGTNVDCRARKLSDGLYALWLSFDRSWVDGDVFVVVQKVPGPPLDNSVGKFAQPIIRRFRSENDFNIREGQTLETTVGTDPLNGRVGKIEVSVTVIK